MPSTGLSASIRSDQLCREEIRRVFASIKTIKYLRVNKSSSFCPEKNIESCKTINQIHPSARPSDGWLVTRFCLNGKNGQFSSWIHRGSPTLTLLNMLKMLNLLNVLNVPDDA